MRSRPLAAIACSILAAGGALFLACGTSQSGSTGGAGGADSGLGNVGADAAGATDAGSNGGCTACASAADCPGAVCAQVAGDSFCMPACPDGGGCASDTACVSIASVGGSQENVCVPRTDICGTNQGAPTTDAGSTPTACGALLPPTSDAGCSSPACTGKHCGTPQPNGCSTGWYCNPAGNLCQPPSVCTSPGVPFDGGAAVTGTVGIDGGTVSRLLFAVVGDTRPAEVDDTAGYPTQIIGRIFNDITALSPRPSFVVATGDYQYASVTKTEQAAQVALYAAAAATFPGPVFPAMGNHECTGYTDSNCLDGGSDDGGDEDGGNDGITLNYIAFMSQLLAPIGQTSPFYSINVNATDGSWTSKFVFIAANAWTDAQGTWLDQTLSVPTTYTFVIRHEEDSANTAPGVGPTFSIIDAHPYTLIIVGHTHSYSRPTISEVLIGNGGAPLSGTGDYGFGVFSQQSDGTIAVDVLDYATGLADPTFHFVIQANGTEP
jgi:hypothetical protein